MAEFRATDFTGKIIWMGSVPEQRENIRSASVDSGFASYAGFAGDHHAGLTRASCVRVKNLHPQGTDIRNTRQFSILSVEEMREIAASIGVDELDPSLLGVSILIEGIPDFTMLPPASRLQAPSGATLVVDVENGPCNFPAREIENDKPGHGKAFKAAARGKRGVTAWVEREGALALGEELRLFVPNQPTWPHL